MLHLAIPWNTMLWLKFIYIFWARWLTGKIEMYLDVMGREVIYDIDKDGRITSVSFGEDVMEVKA